MPMPAGYEGITIQMRLSSARPGEAAYREMTVNEANEVLRDRLLALLERKFPGASITVETEGDRPTAEVTGTDDIRVKQSIGYDAEKTALALKWDFSTLGLGLKPR